MNLQLEPLKTSLNKIHKFLMPILQLANAHASNFITEDHWNTLLTRELQDELLLINPDELRALPCANLALKPNGCSRVNYRVKNTDSKDTVLDSNKTSIKPSTSDQTNAGNDTEVNTQVEELKYRNVIQFCQDALNSTIEDFGLAVSLEQLSDLFGSSEMKQVFIQDFMSLKKGHEVETMSRVCAMLVKQTGCQLVIDFGSGKGYLGNNISLQYNIPCLGIDAVLSYTQSAEKRMSLLGKQWDGLSLNAAPRGQKLTRKQKKKLRAEQIEIDAVQNKLVSKDDTEGTSIEVSSKTGIGEMCISTAKDIASKYVPVTMFVDQTTDFMKLVKDNFPGLSAASNYVGDNLGDNLTQKCADDMKKCSRPHTEYSTNKEKPVGYEDYDYGLTVDGASVQKKIVESDVQTNSQCKLMLTGLHTCGNLSSTTLYLFVNNSNLKTVCSVGCCYNLLDEEFVPGAGMKGSADTCGFPMSQFLKQKEARLGATARNLASQSVHRIYSNDEVLQGERFFPRALLEKIVQDTVGRDGVTWKGLRNLEKKSSSTEDYIRRACEKLDIANLISDDMITRYAERYADCKQKLAAFFQLRAVLAPCIESYLLMDRLCYLLEQENIKKAYLVKLFDPVVSPRCYAIVAFKH